MKEAPNLEVFLLFLFVLVDSQIQWFCSLNFVIHKSLKQSRFGALLSQGNKKNCDLFKQLYICCSLFWNNIHRKKWTFNSPGFQVLILSFLKQKIIPWKIINNNWYYLDVIFFSTQWYVVHVYKKLSHDLDLIKKWVMEIISLQVIWTCMLPHAMTSLCP